MSPPAVPRRGQIVDCFLQVDPRGPVQTWPAIVAGATDGSPTELTVDLVVFNPHNGTSPLLAVPHATERRSGPHWWAWPGRSGTRRRLRESAAPVTEAGARHSRGDQTLLDEAHDKLVAAGARCPMPPVQEAAERALSAAEPLAATGAVICTHNVGLVAYLLSAGLVPEGTPVLDKPTADAITGRVVWSDSMLPLELAILAAQIAIIPLNLPADLQGWPVNLEEIQALAQPPRYFTVREETPALPASADLAAQEAARDPHRRPLTESVAAVREAVAPDGFDATKGVLTVTIIRPGFNTAHSRFYTPAAMAAVAEAMNGRKMYLNHATPSEMRERPEGDLRHWVSVISETWVDPADGAAKGKATITDPDFLARAKRLAETGLLSQLGASINAVGIGEDVVLEGAATFRVDAIDADDPFRSVDWVTEPGAGGRAELLEADATGARPAALREETNVVDPNTNPPPAGAGAANADAAQDTARDQAIAALQAAHAQITQQDTARDQAIAALQAAHAQITQQIQQIADRVDQVINAAGLDSLLSSVQGATEAARARVRTKLLAQPGPYTEAQVREALTAEVREAAAVIGARPGVTGFGAGPDPAEPVDAVAALRESQIAHGVNADAFDAALRERLGD